MKLTNGTTVNLKIMGRNLMPGETRVYPERCHDALNIESEIGACVIKTYCKKRSFDVEGQLEAREGKEDDFGMKEVIICQKTK